MMPPAISAQQVEELADAAFLTDPDGSISVWNPAACELLGYEAGTAVGRRCAELLDGIGAAGGHVCALPCPMLLALHAGRPAAAHPDMVVRRADGERVRLSVMAMRVERDGVAMLLHQVRDEPLSERDPLTGALSRHAFVVRLLDEQNRARRSGSSLALAMVDVDGLKSVNDGHGHDAGDRVLLAVASALRQGRRSDLVGRWGGDEFAVLLPDTAAADAAPRLCRTLDSFEREVRVGGRPVSFSAGIVPVDPRAQIHRVMARADAALYHAKRSGRGRVDLGATIEVVGRARVRTRR